MDDLNLQAWSSTSRLSGAGPTQNLAPSLSYKGQIWYFCKHAKLEWSLSIQAVGLIRRMSPSFHLRVGIDGHVVWVTFIRLHREKVELWSAVAGYALVYACAVRTLDCEIFFLFVCFSSGRYEMISFYSSAMSLWATQNHTLLGSLGCCQLCAHETGQGFNVWESLSVLLPSFEVWPSTVCGHVPKGFQTADLPFDKTILELQWVASLHMGLGWTCLFR